MKRKEKGGDAEPATIAMARDRARTGAGPSAVLDGSASSSSGRTRQ